MTTGNPADVALDDGGAGSTGGRRELARSAALLSAAWIVANLATYLLSVLGSRRLGPTGYGVLGPLLGVLAVVSVPGLALQTFVARRAARDEIDLRLAVRTGIRLGIGGAVVGALLLPELAALLHLTHALSGLAAALLMVLPVAVVSAVQGWLQGREQFRLLSALVVLVGVARLGGGVLPLLAGATGSQVMVGIFVATAVVGTGAGLAAVCRAVPTQAGKATKVGRWGDLAAALLGLGGLLVLANLDLLLARQLLPSAASGRYAAGAVICRVALWLPQAVSLAVLPRLTHSLTRLGALRDAVVATAAVGALGVLVTALAGGLLTSVAFGSAYRSLGSVAWQFAMQGAALAIVQLMVVDDIARARRGLLPVLALAVVGETVVLETMQPRTVSGVVAVAVVTACGAAALAGARVLLEVGRGRRPAGRSGG